MEDTELRMECLRLASNNANSDKHRMELAREFYNFVAGKEAALDPRAVLQQVIDWAKKQG